jgi:glucose-1-phosphate thymidylyltransferase
MLPIANKPMLAYGLDHLRNAGITEIGIILGPTREGISEVVGDGQNYGVKVSYINQPEPKGLAHAVILAQDFMGTEPFVMYLGDNLLKEGVIRMKDVFEATGADCVIGLIKVDNPSSFGVAELKDGKVVHLAEKPKNPTSNLALIGVYVFNSSIFEVTRELKPSLRGELEITDAIQMLVDRGKKVEAVMVEGWWKDTGKPEDLLEANQLILSDLTPNIQGSLSDETHYTGPISVGRGTKMFGRVNIRGPVIIGEDCKIGPDVHIGPYTSIGTECVLKNVDIENSIVMKGCTLETGKRIVDSLIGSQSTVVDGSNSLPQGQRLIIGENSFAQI